MMNKRTFKLVTFAATVLFILSCKKVEDKFPPGYYQFDVDMEEIGGYEEDYSSKFNVKLLESNETYLKVRFFKGDTLWDEPGILTIIEEENFEGTFGARLNGDKPIIIESGIIIRENRNSFIIEGVLSYEVLFDAGWDIYWRKYRGIYTFHPK